ncbi:hypothetical protein C8R46DRAFT_277128 [Mycena filopes]|nr:hypothetical protein C8R46DRAFT_277128 [Mycena filopes]
MLSLDQDRARITVLDAQILELRLERSLSKLRAARAVVQTRLDAFKYPVLTLPNEVVGEIFTQFVPLYPLRPPLVGPGSPVLLTHICHLWREIAVKMPTLWRAINLSNFYPSRSQQAYFRDICFTRSLSMPLSLASTGDADHLPAIIAHRNRWEYIKIDLLLPPLIAFAIEGPMPLLRQLDVTVNSFTEWSSDTVALLDVPLLHSVILDGYAARHFTLPWEQITSFTLNRGYREECTPLLAQTRNLVHCRLLLFNEPNSGPPPRVLLPHLETLVMTQEGVSPVLEYLDTFVAPALLTLEVPESFLGPDPIAYLSSFISTSGCKLREVVITGKEIKFIDSYRSAFPSIDRFSFRRYYPHGQGYDEIHSNPDMSVPPFQLDLSSPA